MSVLTLASDPEDAAALEVVEAHHARLAGELAGRVTMLVTAARTDPSAAEKIRAGLVGFCDRSLLPQAAAKEAALYPAAHGMHEARLLIESLIGEHRCLTALIDALRVEPTSADAAADARALQVLFEEHLAKENGLVLPLLAMTPEISLAELQADMHHRLANITPTRAVDGPQDNEEGQDVQDELLRQSDLSALHSTTVDGRKPSLAHRTRDEESDAASPQSSAGPHGRSRGSRRGRQAISAACGLPAYSAARWSASSLGVTSRAFAMSTTVRMLGFR
ncbi:hemerythrin domain-containing protein [Streptomyces sp. NPDC019531]|uniref:hemerythrin domain-containing protein n=1 Tax=Streptomyces sp. NPDC019531 TaxID=3365062 RepID=UPI00385005FB